MSEHPEVDKNEPPLHVTIFVPAFGDGGVERDMVHTARGLADLGVRVDFVTADGNKPYLADLPSSVTRVDLGGEATDPNSYQRLIDYLRATPPDVLLSAKDKAHETAVIARSKTAVATRLVMRLGTVVSRRHGARRFWRRIALYRRIRRNYACADHLIAISNGVASDVACVTGIARQHFSVIPSPVLTPAFLRRVNEPVEHPWLTDTTVPTLVAVGRLAYAKGFDNLLRGFAIARRQRRVRLIILGEGRLHGRLMRLARRLRIEDDVDWPGFVSNPYPYIAAADLFVLTSRFEGLGNVLVEATAAGTPIVATDCPVGPREVLQNNAWAELVPVDQPTMLAAAIQKVLDWPVPPHDELREAMRDYTLEVSARRYRNTLADLAHTT